MSEPRQPTLPPRLEAMAQGLYRDLRPHLADLPWPEFRRLLLGCLRQALAEPVPPPVSDPPPGRPTS